MSWLFVPNNWASVSLPFGPTNTYGLSTFTQGSWRRCRLSSSRSRVNSFSFSRSVFRAESHCSRETTVCSRMAVLPSFVMCHLMVSKPRASPGGGAIGQLLVQPDAAHLGTRGTLARAFVSVNLKMTGGSAFVL